MVGNLPPPPAMAGPGGPNAQAQAQVNIDANLTAAATMLATAAVRPDHPQAQNAQDNGRAQPERATYPESHGAEYQAGAHEQAYGSSAPPQAPMAYADNTTYTDNTAYADNSSYAVNNTYNENTDIVNTTIYIDNSTEIVTDTTNNNTSYIDATYNSTDANATYTSTDAGATYSSMDVSAMYSNSSVDAGGNATAFTDSSATGFSLDGEVSVVSSDDVTAAAADYSGSIWGLFDF